MKQIFNGGILLGILLMVCSNCGTKQEPAGTTESVKVNRFISVYQKRIDGCEYLILHGYEMGGIIHKANCDNHGNK